MQTIDTTALHDRLDWRIQWRRFRALRWKDFALLFQEVFNKWSEDRVPRLAASVAFFTILSMAPLLIIVVAIAASIFGREAAEGQLVWQIEDLVGRAGAEIVQTLLKSTQQPGAGILATILGAIALFVGATTAVAEVRDALNTVWCVPQRELSTLQSIRSLIVDRTLAFGAVVGIGFVLMLSLAVNATISAFSKRYEGWLATMVSVLLQSADVLVAFVVITLLFALIYKFLPDLYLEWRDVLPGAVFAAMLFGAGRYLLGLYLGRASYVSAYGAAGSLVVVLVWIYYSAQIFFLGAEFARSWAQTFGSKPCDRIGKEVRIAERFEEAAEPVEPAPPEEQGQKPPEEPLIRLS